MSERQAKLKRKNHKTEDVVKKKSKSEILFNILVVALVVAFVGLGTWAVTSKYVQNAQIASTQTEEDAQESITIEEYAQSMGITSGEFITEFGLDQNENISTQTLMDEAINYMTLENYAKLTGSTVDDTKTGLGLGDEVTGETLMSEVSEILQENTEESTQAE